MCGVLGVCKRVGKIIGKRQSSPPCLNHGTLSSHACNEIWQGSHEHFQVMICASLAPQEALGALRDQEAHEAELRTLCDMLRQQRNKSAHLRKVGGLSACLTKSSTHAGGQHLGTTAVLLSGCGAAFGHVLPTCPDDAGCTSSNML